MIRAIEWEPPEHLTPESKALWGQVVKDVEIDAAAYPMLVILFEARDRREEARQRIAETGAVLKDRFNQLKRNPWADVERDNAQIMLRAFSALGFTQAPSGKNQLELPLG